MSCDWPEPGECCLGIPRRIGLVGAAAGKMGINVLMAGVLAQNYPFLSRDASTSMLVLLWSVVVLLLTDMVFSILLSQGCLKKDPVLLFVFHRYSQVLRGFYALLVIGLIIFEITLWFSSRFDFYMFLPALICIVVFCGFSIFIHAWLSEITMGEVKMLKEAAQVQFTNDATVNDSIHRTSLNENV